MRLGDLDALKEAITKETYNFEQIPIRVDKVQEIIDNAPTVETSKVEYKAYNEGFKDGVEQGIKLSETPGEWIETKHRVNLLIGVLYSNQVISKSDLEYIEDSIKKLMKGKKAGEEE